MRKLILRWLINTLGLFVAVAVVSGIVYDGPAWKMVIVAAVFGVVNALLRPLLALLTCPLIVLTLGLFTLVVNGAMLLLTARLAGALGVEFSVGGIGAAVLGALVVTVVSVVISLLIGTPERREREWR